MLAWAGRPRRHAGRARRHAARSSARALEEGAVGLSAGLTYTPGMYAERRRARRALRAADATAASTARTTATTGCTRSRRYADSIEIARRSGAPLHLAHAHLGFADQQGRAPELLAMIDAARDDGVDITLDTYPVPGGRDLPARAAARAGCTPAAPDAIDRAAARPGLRERLRVEIEETGLGRLPRRPDRLGQARGRRRLDRRAAAREGKRPIDVVCERCADVRPLGLGCSRTSATRRTCARPCSTPRTRPAATASSSATQPHPRG